LIKGFATVTLIISHYTFVNLFLIVYIYVNLSRIATKVAFNNTEWLVNKPIPFLGSQDKPQTIRPGVVLEWDEEYNGTDVWNASGFYAPLHIPKTTVIENSIDLRQFLNSAANAVSGSFEPPVGRKIFKLHIPGNIRIDLTFYKRILAEVQHAGEGEDFEVMLNVDDFNDPANFVEKILSQHL
jgi:hypothetical protein